MNTKGVLGDDESERRSRKLHIRHGILGEIAKQIEAQNYSGIY
ncbi:hypothetical protein [Clostridium estertheticum]|nr:hypothetical protein [Clostridium estertheticum]